MARSRICGRSPAPPRRASITAQSQLASDYCSSILGQRGVDIVADWPAANERGLARTTASIALLTLRSVCRFAVRKGWLAINPVTLLEPLEKPRWRPAKVDILEGEDLARVLDSATR